VLYWIPYPELFAICWRRCHFCSVS